MSDVLKSFENDLGEISSKIQSLLDGSKTIHKKLAEKRANEVELEVLTKNITIDDELVAGIYQTPMNETFLHYTKILSRIKAFIQAQQAHDISEIKALEDLQPELIKLQDKMVGRVRQLLLQKIYAMNPNTNIQMLQQKLLKYRPFYDILLDFNLDIADEVKTKYIETISSYLVPNFKLYISSLLKHQLPQATKYDLLGNPNTKKSYTTAGVFSLGNRAAGIFDKTETSPIIPHIAAKEGKKFNFERIFFSIHRVLLDTVSGEVAFHIGFFNTDFFRAIFSGIVSQVDDLICTHLETCYDSISLLIMLVIIEKDIKIMNTRRITNLDPYFAETRMKLLSRFQTILDLNIESIKNARVKDMGILDQRPHYLTRRYTEYVAAICTLLQFFANEIGKRSVLSKMKTLCLSFDELMVKMANDFADKPKKTLFLINNYDLIIEILNENSITSFETKFFGDKLDDEISNCIEIELSKYFADMNDFVKKMTINPDSSINKDIVIGLTKKFNSNWKLLLGTLSKNIMTSFPNLRTGSNVLKRCYQQLFANYKRFQDIVKASDKDLFNQVSQDFVPFSTLTYEVKQFDTEFV